MLVGWPLLRSLWRQGTGSALYCRHHGGGYYFYGISIQTWGPGEEERWADEPDMKKVRGTCMQCAKRSIFFVNEAELDEHRYRPIELCPRCGLPYEHEAPPSAFLQQYNALPVPCRQSDRNNGQPTNIH